MAKSRPWATRYQRPGTASGKLVTEEPYEAPNQPSTPDNVLETTAKDSAEREPDRVPDVLPPPSHVDLGEAVPVRIVQFTRELDRVTRFAASSRDIGANESLVLVSARRNRSRLLVTNAGQNPVILGHQLGTSGYPLAGGATVELFHTASVWAFSASGSTVGIIEEYTTELE